MIRKLLALALVLSGGLLTGCSNTYSLELTTEDHGAVVDELGIQIPVGKAIGVAPLEDDDLIDEDTRVRLESTDRSIMEIEETGEFTEFVLWGVSVGGAEVEVFIDGERAGFIAVDVLPRED